MKPGERVFWLRHERVSGSHARVRIPAVYIGLKSKTERDSGTVFALVDGKVERKTVKLHNLLARDMDKEIDTAIEGLALYNGKPLTQQQYGALTWLRSNGGLEVPNMNLNGRSKEWPTHRTLEALQERGLITFEQKTTHWRCEINELGEAVLQEEYSRADV